MHSPGPSPTDSPINLLEKIPSKDEITTNIIISDVTDENGKTKYYISGIQKEEIHVPSQISDRPVFQPDIINIPPCACAIHQVYEKGHMSPSESKDNITWTKDEGLCPGKKYRPKETGAYSCKKYPGDKSCRRNPFIKDVLKMEKKKKEEQERKEEEKEEEKEEKAEVLDTIKEEDEIKEEKEKFIPDLTYPGYDSPWNLLRTAPSDVSKTDYEQTLKLTSPVLPVICTSKAQVKQKNISSSNNELRGFGSTKNKNISNNPFYRNNPVKIPFGNPSNLLESIKERKKGKNKIDRHIKQNRKILLNKITTNKKDTQSSNIISMAENKIEESQLESSSDKIIKEQCSTDKIQKWDDHKENEKKIEQLDKKRKMARLKNMLKLHMPFLRDIQPAKEEVDEICDSKIPIDEEISYLTRKDPCGWRTKSEQELPAKKTLVYLCEPDYPMETMETGPGGRPCKCRENRNKKKILKYNIGGFVAKNWRGPRKTKLKEENRLIDGVTFLTPSISPRRSDEYIPEYDLVESPYEICERTNERSKLIEKYSGPKSLVEKSRKRKPASCTCSGIAKKAHLADEKESIEKARQKLMELKSPEERWNTALKDPVLMDYFTKCKDKTFCWTSCRKFAQNIR